MTEALRKTAELAREAANVSGGRIEFYFSALVNGNWGTLRGKVYPDPHNDGSKWLTYEVTGPLPLPHSELNARQVQIDTLDKRSDLITEREFDEKVVEAHKQGKVLPVRPIYSLLGKRGKNRPR